MPTRCHVREEKEPQPPASKAKPDRRPVAATVTPTVPRKSHQATLLGLWSAAATKSAASPPPKVTPGRPSPTKKDAGDPKKTSIGSKLLPGKDNDTSTPAKPKEESSKEENTTPPSPPLTEATEPEKSPEEKTTDVQNVAGSKDDPSSTQKEGAADPEKANSTPQKPTKKTKKRARAPSKGKEASQPSESTDQPNTSPPAKKVKEEPSPEYNAWMDELNRQAQQCQEQRKLLLSQAGEAWKDKEEFNRPTLKEMTEVSEDDLFPPAVLSNLLVLVEGSPLGLPDLTKDVQTALMEKYSEDISPWSLTALEHKIQLIAQCNSYDESLTRWEVVAVDVLPAEMQSSAQAARTLRRKWGRRLAAWQAWETLCRQSPPMDASGLAKHKAKFQSAKDKVYKLERQAEKQRLVQEQAQRAKEEKERLLEAKRKEKEEVKQQKQKEKVVAKQRKQQEKEDAKKREIEAKKREEEAKASKLRKQKACLLSFLDVPAKTQDDPKPKVASVKSEGYDALSSLQSQPNETMQLPWTRSSHRQRRKRKATVPVNVYVTVFPNEQDDCTDVNPFAANTQPYAELRTIHVSNRYKFLLFHEDVRPPYFGTWSKSSKLVTGRKPFGKDETFLDYDHDSEAEWEEGDDEIGEDLEDDDGKNQEDEEDDEEGDPSKYNYSDGFCVADDQYLETDENVDEETKLLYKKKLSTLSPADGASDAALPHKVCVVQPLWGGRPRTAHDPQGIYSEGMEAEEVPELIEAHASSGVQLGTYDMCLDAFPPALFPDEIDEEEANKSENSTNGTEEATATKNQDYTKEELEIFVRLVHHNTLQSREKVIEELKAQNPTLFGSRARALRKLDKIADKKRRKKGVFWEVKKESLVEAGCQDLVDKPHGFELPTKKVTKLTAKSQSDSATSTATTDNKKSTKPKKRATLLQVAASPPGKPADKKRPIERPATSTPKAKKRAIVQTVVERESTKEPSQKVPTSDANPPLPRSDKQKSVTPEKTKTKSPQKDKSLLASQNVLASFLKRSS